MLTERLWICMKRMDLYEENVTKMMKLFSILIEEEKLMLLMLSAAE